MISKESLIKKLMDYNKEHTLSFRKLDDKLCKWSRSWTYREIPELKRIISKFWKDNTKSDPKDEDDYFFNEFSWQEIYYDLLRDKYFVANRFEKYYVYAFSIDHKRFWIWSKDCEAEIIDLGDNSGEVANNLDPDYDVNPVVKLLEALNKY